MPIVKTVTNIWLRDITGMQSQMIRNVTALKSDHVSGILTVLSSNGSQSFAIGKWHVGEIEVIEYRSCSTCGQDMRISESTRCLDCQIKEWHAVKPVDDEPGDHATQPCQTVEIRS
jgi:hypothetical protein